MSTWENWFSIIVMSIVLIIYYLIKKLGSLNEDDVKTARKSIKNPNLTTKERFEALSKLSMESWEKLSNVYHSGRWVDSIRLCKYCNQNLGNNVEDCPYCGEYVKGMREVVK